MTARTARTARERTIGIAVAAGLLLLLGWAATRHANEHSRRTEQTVAALRSSGIESPRADVQGIVATVYGLAGDASERDSALQAAGRIEGVRDVVDRLTVTASPSGTPVRVAGDPQQAPTVEGGARLASGTLAAQPADTTPTGASPATANPTPAQHRQARSPAVQMDEDAPCEMIPSALSGARIAFFEGTASVSAGGRVALRSVAQHMTRCPDIVLRIDARATQAGTPKANLQLSRLRSQAVSNHLDGHGVAVSRMVATYRGDRAPSGNHADLTMYAGGQR